MWSAKATSTGDCARRSWTSPRAHRGQREFGLSMALGDLLTGQYPDSLVIICRDRHAEPLAFQRYLPCRGETALPRIAWHSVEVAAGSSAAAGGTDDAGIVAAVPDQEPGARQLIEDLAGVLPPGQHPSQVRSHGVADADGQQNAGQVGLVGTLTTKEPDAWPDWAARPRPRISAMGPLWLSPTTLSDFAPFEDAEGAGKPATCPPGQMVCVVWPTA